MQTLARLVGAAALLALSSSSAPALAQPSPVSEEPPDRTLAFVTGAATAFAGFTLGGTIMAVAGDDPAKTNAGWLIIEGGLTLAPLSAHVVNGEWGRGAIFAAIPGAATLGSLPSMLENPRGSVDHGSIEEQRVMWSFFGVALFASAVGVVDAALPRKHPRQALRVLPALGATQAGIVIGGAL
jgi:hypothetical protein